ncbi:hypothetical protein BpHYR1_023157 [Brachionus plicatilis]|uniref:Uncharacterized protein n=1 Tax=Brachionus plicatilis TaxID=10195 RepID=A0A3M7SYK1_BRAPC|nr:hypothetical protein BpHYR1_023157 [Brachionus plicatilis]
MRYQLFNKPKNKLINSKQIYNTRTTIKKSFKQRILNFRVFFVFCEFVCVFESSVHYIRFQWNYTCQNIFIESDS